MKISILGVGNMGGLFAKGLADKYEVFGTVAGGDLENLEKTYPQVKFTNNTEAVANADVVLLCVKPQNFSDLTKEIKGKIGDSTLVISIMAGVSLATIKSGLGFEKVVRSIPNLGAKLKKSITVWSGKNLEQTDKELVKTILQSIGKEMEVESEDLIDKATALSGSGPGFYFYLVEEWLKAGEELGFSKEQAEILLFSTLEISNELLQQEKNPKDLTAKVASKGGTTEAGLKVLQKYAPKMWRKTLNQAYKRAKELSS